MVLRILSGLLLLALPVGAASQTKPTKPAVQVQTEKAWAAAVRVGKSPASCARSIGLAQVKALVRYCRFGSPSTRPPCNSANSCDMIVDHIGWSNNAKGASNPAVLPGTPLKASEWRAVASLDAL